MVYIGKTIKTLNERKLHHFRIMRTGSNFYFHRALKRYGKNNFTWEILHQTNKEDHLNVLEKFYILYYRTKGKLYNLTDGGEGTSGRIISEETRRKMSEAQKGEKNHSYGKVGYNKGKKFSLEFRKKLSESHKGQIPNRKGQHHTEATKEKLRQANLGKRHTKESLKKMSLAQKLRWQNKKNNK